MEGDNINIAIFHYDLPKTNWHASELQNITYRHLKDFNINYKIIFHGEEFIDFKGINLIDMSEFCNPWHQQLAKQFKGPIVVSSEEGSVKSLRNYLSINKIDIQFMLSRISHFIARSSWTRDMLVEFGVDSNKISIISYGVDTDIFKSANNELYEPSFLYVGSLNKRKGVNHLIDAYLKIIDKTDWKLELCVGEFNNDTELLENIKTLTKKYGKIQLSSFPSIRQLPDIYQKSSCFCLVQDKDSPVQFSYPSLWALSCGLPIISLNIGAIKDYVKDEENGFLCDKIDKLPEKMLEITKRDLTKIRNISRTIAENHHSSEKIASKYKYVYYKILEEK